MHFLPTRRTALLFALAAPFWLWAAGEGGIVPGMIAIAVVLSLVVLDLAISVRPARIEVDRELEDRLWFGSATGGAWRLTSHAARQVSVELFDRWPATMVRLDEEGSPWPAVSPTRAPVPDAVATIPPAGEVVLPFNLRPMERGWHSFGTIAIRVPGPLGLISRTRRLALDHRVLVTPSLEGVRHYRLLAMHHRLREAGVRTIRRRGEGTSFASLREYVPGDDPRRIDWKATARRSRIMMREQDVEQGQTIIIAVDAGRRMLQVAGDRPRFEHALNAALVLADVATQSGDRVGMIAFDDAIRAWVPPVRGNAAVERIREALIPLRASMAEPDYAFALQTLVARHRKRALIVLLTDVVESRTAQALVAHLTRGGARHLPLIIALRDDVLLEVAAGRVRLQAAAAELSSSEIELGGSPAAYERAAAEELLIAREEAIVRMRRSGASVVDVSPHDMASAVVNRYLELKRRGAL